MPSCECGQPKITGAESCPACAFLDGACTGEAAVIDAVRVQGGQATVRIEVREVAPGVRHVREKGAGSAPGGTGGGA